MGQRLYDTSSVHRISQAALVKDRLTAGISPTTVTGLAAMIAQMESQLQAPLLSVTITSAFPGFQRSITYQNAKWSGHDLTHHFHDDRALFSLAPRAEAFNKIAPFNSFLRPLHLNNQCCLQFLKLLKAPPPELRKLKEHSPTRPVMPPPQNVKNTPLSNPPQEKKTLNEKTPTS